MIGKQVSTNDPAARMAAVPPGNSSGPKVLQGPKGKWGPTLKIIKSPRAAFDEWIAKYGDPFFVHALNGPIVVTGRADLIKLVFGGDPDHFSPFATQTIGPTINVKLGPSTGVRMKCLANAD